MITIIHGDDISASRLYYNLEKNNSTNPLVFPGEMLSLTDLAQALQGSGLFSATSTIFIEDMLSERKAEKDINSIVKYLNDNHTNAKIFIWEGKLLQKKTLLQFKTSVVKDFKLPKVIFSFLDLIKPNSGKKLLSLFHQVRQHSEDEIILYMLIRQFRMLLSIKTPSADAIDEVKRMAPWQTNRVEYQSSLFSEDALINLYKELFDIDLKSKTGQLQMPLSHALDFFLLAI